MFTLRATRKLWRLFYKYTRLLQLKERLIIHNLSFEQFTSLHDGPVLKRVTTHGIEPALHKLTADIIN